MSKRRNSDHKGIEHDEGSGNVFADLGLPDADERLARSKLAFMSISSLSIGSSLNGKLPPCSASSSQRYLI